MDASAELQEEAVEAPQIACAAQNWACLVQDCIEMIRVVSTAQKRVEARAPNFPKLFKILCASSTNLSFKAAACKAGMP